MTWDSLLSDLSGVISAHAAAASYIRGVVIGQAVRAGASANSILNSLTGAGLGIRRTQGLALVREEVARQALGATSAQINLAQPIDESVLGGAPAGWNGQIIHQVSVVYRTRDEEGNYLLHTRTLGIKSSTVLTPEEAIVAAQSILTQTAEPGASTYIVDPGSVLSMSLSGAWYDTQGRNVPSVN